jgi:hypothetical protein
MPLRKLTLEHLLYSAALILALFVRLVNLGAAPLSELEASWALQALDASPFSDGNVPQAAPPGSQPAYVLLTGLLFSLLGSSEGLARLLPALAGSLLVLAPAMFRGPLGRRAALLLAFGLALDPGLAAVSRQAGGPMPALSFSMLALGFAWLRRPVVAGILAGMALLSGPAVLLGAVGLGLAWLVFRLLIGRTTPVDNETSTPEEWMPRQPLRSGLAAAGVTVLVVGTLFLLAPQGLAGWANTLPDFLSGWLRTSRVLPLTPAAALLLYAPLPLLFAAVSAVRALVAFGRTPPPVEDNEEALEPAALENQIAFLLGLLIWAVIALLIVLLYPARQVADLVWVLVPLWALASVELARHIPRPPDVLVSLGQAVVIVVLFALARLNLASMSLPFTTGENFNLRLAVLGGLVLLLLITSLLIALGWSARAAANGLVWGVGVGLLFYTVAALWGAAHVRHNSPLELWAAPPGPGQMTLLRQTVREMARLDVGHPGYLSTALAVDSAALRWELRDILDLVIVQQPQEAGSPTLIITDRSAQTPALASGYRGQEFIWRETPAWTGALPPNFTGWWLKRTGPLLQDHIILWVREDIFPNPTTGETEP